MFCFWCLLEDSTLATATQAEKEEVDSRSIYVGNVSFLSFFIFFRNQSFLLQIIAGWVDIAWIFDTVNYCWLSAHCKAIYH